jgi:signal transduction histidine kinase
MWAIGELVIRHGGAPEEVLLGRRILYLGTALLPIGWIWTAAVAAQADWLRRAPWRLALPALLQAFFYSCLYWDTRGWFVAWSQQTPAFGPLFWAHAGLSWTLIGLGVVYFFGAAVRLRKASPERMLSISVAALAPLLGNIVYLIAQPGVGNDPTPILLGFGILLIRLAVLESGLTPFLPVARRDVIEQLRVGVLVADLDGRIVDANPAAGWILRKDIGAGTQLDAVLAGAAADTTRSIEVQTFPVSGSFGEVGRCAVLTDRTEAGLLERKLLQAQKLEAIGFLTAGIAHEVNNPLAFVRANLGSIEELAKGLSDPTVRAQLPEDVASLAAECPEIVDEIRDGVNRISRLVERLRGFARREAPVRERRLVEMQAIAEKARSLAGVGLARGAIRIRSHPAPAVWGNEGELVQIVLNLLVNAVQASEEPLDIDVEIRAARAGVILAVRDRGPGISKDALPHLFDPFFTTKAPGEGTGLGLSLSFDLARQHGGTLEAGNRPDGGAVFELWLPAAEAGGEDA